MIEPPRAQTLNDASSIVPAAVYVHGIEDEWRTWLPLAGQLTAWRSLALDMPWRAGNDYRWRWHASPANWIGAGLDALETAGLVVGHSFGASGVLSLLAQGKYASAAVLINPIFRPAEARPSWTTLDRARQTFERQLDAGLRSRLSARGRRLPDDILARMHARTCERIGLVGFLTVFDEYLRCGHLPIDQVRVPTLILGGGRDPSLSRRHLQQLADQLPDCQLVVQDDYDHFCHVHQAMEVADLIQKFTLGAGLPITSIPE